ncbi:hypothetical protein [Flavobacterium sp.]|uniref:hypothetical protein n=1 Tax=Flavobacterium sp. TaxID=239 RepID=UPI00260469B7|nr:hypothetical protein [Flavobacterium sp.]
MNFELQKLLFPSNCQIIKNDFTIYDPETEYSEENSIYNLTDYLLQIEFVKSNIVVDLGWYGDFETNNEYFKIVVLKNSDWENPLKIEISKSQRKINEKLNAILMEINQLQK